MWCPWPAHGCPRGQDKEKMSFWRDELDVPGFVLDVIEHSHVLSLKSEPVPFVGENQAICFANKEFVGESIGRACSGGPCPTS